jgi:hypothetical protein
MRLVFLISVILLNSAMAAENLAGHWEGSIQLPNRGYDLILDLDQPGGKDWVGSVTIPGLSLKGAPLTKIAINGAEISFALDHALASPRIEAPRFQARLSGSDRLEGTFLQAGNRAPLTLRKTGLAQVELPPRSTAIGNDWVGEWKGDYEMDGYPRHVTLTLAGHGSDPGTASILVVGKRTTKVPVDFVSESENFLTVRSRETGVAYEGRLAQAANEIRGTWTIGPFELPLVLKRSAQAQ